MPHPNFVRSASFSPSAWEDLGRVGLAFWLAGVVSEEAVLFGQPGVTVWDRDVCFHPLLSVPVSPPHACSLLLRVHKSPGFTLVK